MNAFTIPKKSIFNTAEFRRDQKYHTNFPPIALKGSSTNPPPKMMRKPQ